MTIDEAKEILRTANLSSIEKEAVFVLLAELETTIENLPNEEWRDITGYEGLYQVSNCGRVKSLKYGRNGRILRRAIQKGYVSVQLGKYGKKAYVHRLVAEAFIPNPFNKPCVNHINGNKSDNHVGNLEWATSSENQQHAVDTGLKKSGGECWQSCMTNEQVEYCRTVYTPYDAEFGLVALAKKLGVSKHVIYQAVHGKTYGKADGKKHESYQRISETAREEIKQMYKQGVRGCGSKTLAKKFGVTSQTILRIVQGGED